VCFFNGFRGVGFEEQTSVGLCGCGESLDWCENGLWQDSERIFEEGNGPRQMAQLRKKP
jgi:hypothetical protein